MSERSSLISRLIESVDSRTSYIKAKLGVLVPSQIRSLRLQSEMPRQSDLAKAAGLHQSRISMFETPGAANMTIETLARLAAAFKVGLMVKFVPMSEMLRWENQYSQDAFTALPIEKDTEFIDPDAVWREQSYARNAEGAAQLGNQVSAPLPLRFMPGFAITPSHTQEGEIGPQKGVSAA
jgi:transcriptional regulator with XRE-family HTH domain